jgi:hypothetical protein
LRFSPLQHHCAASSGRVLNFMPCILQRYLYAGRPAINDLSSSCSWCLFFKLSRSSSRNLPALFYRLPGLERSTRSSNADGSQSVTSLRAEVALLRRLFVCITRAAGVRSSNARVPSSWYSTVRPNQASELPIPKVHYLGIPSGRLLHTAM